jgi:hypothetical protein
MPTLKKFTVVDPAERVNLSLKLSTRTCIEQYRVFYATAYSSPVERGELVEEILKSFFDEDADFQRFTKKLTPGQSALVSKGLGLEEKALSTVQVFVPTTAPVATAAAAVVPPFVVGRSNV